MIGYLKGKILEHADGRMLVDVSSVGYQVTVPASAEYGRLLEGEAVELFIHTHVREDALDLYGFASRTEKELFLTLLTVNGIGPKGAIGILSKVDPASLIQAILTGDKVGLTQIPGIGKKTAERVVLELGEKMKKRVEAGEFGGLQAAVRNKQRAAKISDPDISIAFDLFEDAKGALVGLGYKEQEASQILKRALSELETPPQRVEDLIRTALQRTGMST